MPALSRWGRLGAVTFADILRVEPWPLVILLADVSALVLYVIERGQRRSQR